MTLNTTSTTGILGGHTWRYGSTDDDGNAEVTLSVTDGDATTTFVASDVGDYITLTATDGTAQNYVFCRGDGVGAIGASTGDELGSGGSVGDGRTSNVKGIVVKVSTTDKEGDILTQLRLGIENANSNQSSLFTLTQTGDGTTDGKVTLHFKQNDRGTEGNTSMKAFNWGSGGEGTEIVGAWTDLEQTFPVSFTGGLGPSVPFEDELVIEGKFVNSVAGSDEKAGLTRVNNSTALTSPTTTADATQLGRARDVARAFLAYKKKKK